MVAKSREASEQAREWAPGLGVVQRPRMTVLLTAELTLWVQGGRGARGVSIPLCGLRYLNREQLV